MKDIFKVFEKYAASIKRPNGGYITQEERQKAKKKEIVKRKSNMKKDHDYSVFLAIIAIWVMIGGLAQCESASNLNDIRRELSGIKHELNMLRYK